MSGPRARRRAAAALLAASWLVACRTAGPALPGLAADDPRPAALLEGLAVSGAERNALRAGARVSIEGQRRASFAKQLLLLERPARLRLEIVGLLGQRVAVLATDGTHYDLYRAEQPTLESGDVHAGILFEVAGLALTPEEAVQVALGAPFLPAEGTPAAASAEPLPDGGLRLGLRPRGPDEPRRSVEFDGLGRLARYAVYAPGGELVFEARYGDYRDIGGSAFAHEISVELPATGTHAEIQFQWVELNPPLSDDLFRLELRRSGSWRPSAS